MTDKTAIRDAATVILLRDTPKGRAVLMGQRGQKAAFMPGKFVFPGGAVDPQDAGLPLAPGPAAPCPARLDAESAEGLGPMLLAAAVRELWEETGLRLAAPGTWPGLVPQTWVSFAQPGLVPDPSALRFVFRAVTPPGRPRRFDARFFMASADAVMGDPDDFSLADDELSHLQWVPLTDARSFDLPFITQVVLAELGQVETVAAPAEGVPFVMNDDVSSRVHRIL